MYTGTEGTEKCVRILKVVNFDSATLTCEMSMVVLNRDGVDYDGNLEDSVDPVGDDGGAGKVAFHLCCHTHQLVDLAISFYLYLYYIH